MESKQMITAIISLAVCTVMIVAFAVPVLASLGGGNNGGAGETFSNPEPTLRYAYAEGNIPDFNIDFQPDGVNSFAIGDQIFSPDLENIDLTDINNWYVMFFPIYADETRILIQVEGIGLLIVENGELDVATFGTSGNITNSNGTISVTTDPQSNPYTFDAPSWCYYADIDGEYGWYTKDDISNGLYISNEPLCRYSCHEFTNPYEKIQVYNGGFFTSDPISDYDSCTYHETKDGNRLTESYWTIGDRSLDTDMIIAPIEITTGSGSGSGASDTVMTLVYVIPLLMVAGLVVATIGMFRKS